MTTADDENSITIEATLYEAITSILDIYSKDCAIKILRQCLRYFELKR